MPVGAGAVLTVDAATVIPLLGGWGMETSSEGNVTKRKDSEGLT